MKHAILIDGGFLKPKYKKAFRRRIEARDVSSLAAHLSERHGNGHTLLRIYYYDSPPLDSEIRQPITNTPLNLKSTEVYRHQWKLLSELKKSDFVSVREGILVFRGWEIKRKTLQGLGRADQQNASLSDDDFRANIQQKGVDTKLGLDMAWISFCNVVDRVIILTGDSDFVPAIKAARRNGVQVILGTLGHGVMPSLANNVDVLDTTAIGELYRGSGS